MIEFIFNKAIEFFPQVSGYFLIAIVAGFLVYIIIKHYNKHHGHCPTVSDLRTDFNKSMDKLDITMNGLKDITYKITNGLDSLNKVLLEKNVISQSCFSNGNSPRVINDLGKRLYKESGADNLYIKIKEELLSELSKIPFDSNLDLERKCLNLLIDRMEKPEFKDIKDFTYQHPNFENTPLSYTDILFIIALTLRDEYLKEHNDLKSN